MGYEKAACRGVASALVPDTLPDLAQGFAPQPQGALKAHAPCDIMFAQAVEHDDM